MQRTHPSTPAELSPFGHEVRQQKKHLSEWTSAFLVTQRRLELTRAQNPPKTHPHPGARTLQLLTELSPFGREAGQQKSLGNIVPEAFLVTQRRLELRTP